MINTIKFSGHTHYRCFGKFNREPLKGLTGCCTACSEEDYVEIEIAPGVIVGGSDTPTIETFQFSEDDDCLAMEFCQKHIKEFEWDGKEEWQKLKT